MLRSTSVLFICFFLAACTPLAAPIVESTAAPAPTRAAPTSAPYFQTPSPTSEPSASSTSTSQPAATPTPDPTQPAAMGALTPRGPWLLFAQGSNFTLANLDFSGYQTFTLPAIPVDGWEWIAAPTAQGAFLALRSADNGSIAFTQENQTFDYQVQVVRLPDFQMVRTFPLLSKEAREAIVQETQAEEYDHTQLPILLGAAVSPEFGWSPDGSYLAFSAAMQGRWVQIYLYDTETDRITQLTQGDSHKLFYAWAPDGERVVYHYPTASMEIGVWATRGYGAVSTSGEQRDLSGAEGTVDWMVGWTSDHSFLLEQRVFEGNPNYLHEIDLDTGTVHAVYDEAFGTAAVDPTTGTVAITSAFRWGHDPSGEEQVFLMKPGEPDEANVLSGYYPSLSWIPEMGLFAAEGESRAVLFSADGTIQHTLEGAKYPGKPSPDGKWIFFETETQNYLYSLADGSKVEVPTRTVTWLPDSSGFLAAAGCQDGIARLYLYRQATGWQAEEVPIRFEPCSDFSIITPDGSVRN